MSSRPAARLTSDLLARKGSAQPAAREEDLYRPRRPTAAVVELGGVQSASTSARADHGEPANEPAPEASLHEVPIARPTPAEADLAETDVTEAPAALDAQEEQPAAPHEAAAFTEFAGYTEVEAPAPDITETSPETVEARDDVEPDAGIEAEAVDDAIAETEDTADTAAAMPETADAVLPDLADGDDEDEVETVTTPLPGSEPARTPRPLTPSVLAGVADTADRGRDRRSFGSAITVFGLSALFGVVLAVFWLTADDGLPDLKTWWQTTQPADEATDTPATPSSEETAASASQAPSAPAESTADASGDATASTPADIAAAAVAESAKTEAATAPAAPVPELDVVRIGEDGYPLLAGRAAPLARLVILDNDVPIGTAEADGNGEWVFQGETRLIPGRHAFSVAVGNSEADTTTTDLSAPNAEATLTVPEPAEKPTRTNAAETDDAEPQEDTTSARQSFDAALGVYYVIQLGSLPAEADALRLWREISQRYPKLVDGLEPVVQTAAQSGGGTIHRLRTGPFTSLQKARQLCGDFKKVGQDCLVVKREKTEG